MALSAYEQETIINYNQADQTANIYTHDPRLIRQLDELALKRKEITLIRNGEKMREYNVPKRWVKVRAPKELSEETRAKMAARARERFGRTEKEAADDC